MMNKQELIKEAIKARANAYTPLLEIPSRRSAF